MQPAPAAHAQSVHGCGHGQHGREKMGGWPAEWEGDGSWEFSLGIRPGRLLGKEMIRGMGSHDWDRNSLEWEKLVLFLFH